jgi:hypothetical protein
VFELGLGFLWAQSSTMISVGGPFSLHSSLNKSIWPQASSSIPQKKKIWPHHQRFRVVNSSFYFLHHFPQKKALSPYCCRHLDAKITVKHLDAKITVKMLGKEVQFLQRQTVMLRKYSDNEVMALICTTRSFWNTDRLKKDLLLKNPIQSTLNYSSF